jgi:type IV pilus assembly protein PilM
MAQEKEKLVGLDIGDHTIKLIQLSEEKDGYSLEKLGGISLHPGAMRAGVIEDEDAVVGAIQTLIQQEEVTEKKAAVGLSGRNVSLHTVWVPEVDQENLEALLAWEGEQYLPFPLDELHLDYRIQGETEENGKRWFQVLLAGIRKTHVESYQNALSRAGLEIAVVDCAPLAMENALAASGIVGESESFALLDIGSQLTNVHVVGGGLSLLSRCILLGGRDYTRAIEKSLSVDYEQAEEIKCGRDSNHPLDTLEEIFEPVSARLASDIQRFFSLYNVVWPDLPIEGIIMSGGGAQLAGLEPQLIKVLGLPMEVANPFARVSFSDKEFDPDFVATMAPVSAVVMGLGVRSPSA